MSVRKHVLSKAIDAIELDAELHPTLPILEIAGYSRVLIENHMSIISYSQENISIRVNYGSICICGEGLMITKMAKEQLIIQGMINLVKINREGECR